MMGFLSSIKRIATSIVTKPFESLAATTSGGMSLLAPPATQRQLGIGIASFATAGAGSLLAGGAFKVPTSQALQAMDASGPQAVRGYSPSSYGQRRGAMRMARRRGGYMVSPPAAGLPPSQTGYINRPRRPTRRYYRA